ncbi:MAG: stress response translation initiation inhibitor YciH [Candidatus Methanospirareceae archaeon]
MQICNKCGLPQDLCVCKEIVKEQQLVRVFLTRRKFGKIMTVIEGIDDKDIDLKELSRELKTRCACGGTVKERHIELQGDQLEKVKKVLSEMGYRLEEK